MTSLGVAEPGRPTASLPRISLCFSRCQHAKSRAPVPLGGALVSPMRPGGQERCIFSTETCCDDGPILGLKLTSRTARCRLSPSAGLVADCRLQRGHASLARPSKVPEPVRLRAVQSPAAPRTRALHRPRPGRALGSSGAHLPGAKGHGRQVCRPPASKPERIDSRSRGTRAVAEGHQHLRGNDRCHLDFCSLCGSRLMAVSV